MTSRSPVALCVALATCLVTACGSLAENPRSEMATRSFCVDAADLVANQGKLFPYDPSSAELPATAVANIPRLRQDFVNDVSLFNDINFVDADTPNLPVVAIKLSEEVTALDRAIDDDGASSGALEKGVARVLRAMDEIPLTLCDGTPYASQAVREQLSRMAKNLACLARVRFGARLKKEDREDKLREAAREATTSLEVAAAAYRQAHAARERAVSLAILEATRSLGGAFGRDRRLGQLGDLAKRYASVVKRLPCHFVSGRGFD